MNERNVLPHERTVELILYAQSGDEEAFDILVRHNVALVKSIVKKYLNRGVEYDDLYQVGMVGLVKAIQHYDAAFGVRFSTYAVPMIAGELKRFLRDDGMIKVSRSVKLLGVLALSTREILNHKHNREVGVEEIAEEIGCDAAQVAAAMESIRPHVSLFDPVYDDTDGTGETLLLDRIVSDDDDELKVINEILLKEMLTSLPARDRKIIMMRYFQKKTQSEVAKVLGVSQVQVSRLENKIIERLRGEYSL